MDIKIKVTNPTRRAVTVTIPAADVASSEKEVLKGFTSEAAIPGFRPGKAPEAVVRQKYAKNIDEEVSQRLLAKGYEQIRKEKGFTVYTLADVKKDEAAKGKDVVIHYEVDVLPEFKTPDWKKVKIAAEKITVSDADVEEHLQKIRAQRARFEKTESAAAKGDYVRLGYTAQIDGKDVKEIDAEAGPLAGTESTWEEAGAENEIVAVPAIAKAVIGLKAGDAGKAEFTVPADHAREALRGKTIKFSLTIAEVRNKKLPEVDAEFCKSVGVKDEADLRDQIRKGVEGSKQQAAETTRREKAVEALVAGLELPLPQSAVDSVAKDLFIQYAQLRMRSGLAPGELETKRDEILDEARKAAEVRVRAQVVLARIAEEEKVDLTQEEFTQAIISTAYAEKTPPEKIAKDRNRVATIRRDAILNKALDLILDGEKKAEVVEKA
jgi:trigger factor